MVTLITNPANMSGKNMQHWHNNKSERGNIMIKYFRTKEEFSDYINKRFMNHDSLESMLTAHEPTDEEIIDALLSVGYTDLDNLVEDGHAYQIGEHTNHGWLYEDEVDIDYMKANGIHRELKKR